MTHKQIVDYLLNSEVKIPSCETCDVRQSCVGCYAMSEYRKIITPYEQKLGTDVVRAVEDLIKLQRTYDTLNRKLKDISDQCETARDTIDKLLTKLEAN